MATKPQPQHTPTPWKVNYGKHVDGHRLVDDPALIGPNDEDILGVSEWSHLSLEDAAFIVRAVNAHEALLAVLGDAYALIDMEGLHKVSGIAADIHRNAYLVIAKAKGQ